MDACSWSPELDERSRPWLSAFPPCSPDPDPGLGRGAAAWDVDVGRTRSGEVSSFPSGLCDRKEETEAYLSASCMLTPGSNHPGVPPFPCCWGWRVWGRLREQGGGTGSTAWRLTPHGRACPPSRPRPTPSPGAQPAVCGLLSSTAAALLAAGAAHSSAGRTLPGLQRVSESRSVPAVPPRPSRLPLLSLPASGGVRPDRRGRMLRRTSQPPGAAGGPGELPWVIFGPRAGLRTPRQKQLLDFHLVLLTV